ncbi:putative monocarboxylate permease-like protein [Phaeoacremonium minimum UCRPA7]|uniref:Putative monocarboxylate permease-like protein n=1 Tax=Phaeoacremonium minimum (strain UCR-PA7) TaxID=1286976 RepID=R8BKM7_PHAM7|nr:putative monocarboxylate permease-like protein [Phaeoacremonium minimum UCRPA7]EON99918.1 putative monocarboxylate permease-like protein [Phaeoacremonium minimum UCRPA7]
MDDKEVPVNSSFAPSSQDGKGVVSDNSFSDNEQQGELDYPEGGLQAWLVVSGSAATMFCTFGYLTGFGNYQSWYGEHQLKNYTQSDISWIGSVQIFLNFSGGLVGGPIMDRYGTIAVIPASVLYVVSLVLTSFCKEYYQFFLAQAVLGGICLGLLFNTALAIIGQYFNRRQGLASGIVMAGASLGGVIFPVALNRLLNNVGLSFGWSVRVCALIILVLLAFASLTMKTRLPPTRQHMDYTLMKRPVYILIAAGGWFLNWGMYVPLFYLPSFAITAGLDSEMAPYTVAIFNAVSLFGRIFAGTLADRLGRFNVVVLNGLLCALMQFVWPATNSSAGVYCVSIFSGLFIGSIVSLQAAIVGQITPDPKYIGSMMGITMAIWACGGLTGPPIAGAILNVNGSFDGPAYFAGASLVLGSALFLFARLLTDSRIFVKI